jgi:hypothetical protein
MPLLIAHRGLLDGPDPDLENSPSMIELARRLGYDVEIDLWKTSSGWWLGHDEPQYRVSFEWIKSIDKPSYLDKSHAWIHAKNIDALYELRVNHWEGNLFYHQNDDAVITNTGYIWTFPGRKLTPLSICVMPEWIDLVENANNVKVHGFCTDYIRKIEKILNIGTR